MIAYLEVFRKGLGLSCPLEVPFRVHYMPQLQNRWRTYYCLSHQKNKNSSTRYQESRNGPIQHRVFNIYIVSQFSSRTIQFLEVKHSDSNAIRIPTKDDARRWANTDCISRVHSIMGARFMGIFTYIESRRKQTASVLLQQNSLHSLHYKVQIYPMAAAEWCCCLPCQDYLPKFSTASSLFSTVT